MKKKMERIDDELFRPLTFAEQQADQRGFRQRHTTTGITLLITETEESVPRFHPGRRHQRVGKDQSDEEDGKNQ